MDAGAVTWRVLARWSGRAEEGWKVTNHRSTLRSACRPRGSLSSRSSCRPPCAVLLFYIYLI